MMVMIPGEGFANSWYTQVLQTLQSAHLADSPSLLTESLVSSNGNVPSPPGGESRLA